MKKIFLIIAFLVLPHVSFAYNFVASAPELSLSPAVSMTGISWATTTPAYIGMHYPYSLAFATSSVVAVGGNCNQSFCNGAISRSVDGGATWSGVSVPYIAMYSWTISSIAYGNNRLIATMGNGYGIYSTDGGATWSSWFTSMPSIGQNGLYFNQGNFYAWSGDVGYQSNDGVTWSVYTDIYNTPALKFRKIVTDYSLYVSIDTSGVIRRSPNGFGSWTIIAMPETGTWQDVAYSQGKWVAVSSTGTHRGAYSSNGYDWYWSEMPTVSGWSAVAGNMSPPADGVTPVFPAPASYAYNPLPFTGTFYQGTQCYAGIDFNVENTDTLQTINIDMYPFNQCYSNPLQSFSTSRDIPSVGNYRYRERLRGFNQDLSDSTPWSAWHYFALGSTSYTPPVIAGTVFIPQNCAGWTDVACHFNNVIGGLFYPSLDSQTTLQTTLSTDNLKYRFPLGYVTDFVTIISTSTESSLVVVDATLPSVLPGGGAHIRIDLSHILDPVLNATSTIFNNASAPSTQTFYEITSHYWNIILYLAVVFYVIARIVGSHIVPDLGHMNTDTQDMRAKSFSKAEEERYRYKEWQYANTSYRAKGGYGPFKEDKNSLR